MDKVYPLIEMGATYIENLIILIRYDVSILDFLPA